MPDTNIIQSAEPFFLPGGSVGCLLIHGFTGSPKEMRGLGESLNKQGFTVLGVRLAGHATNVEDMQRMGWEDWYYSVLDGYYLLRTSVSKIFIIGLSLGGALSLFLSSDYPVDGVICLSTPYQLPADPRLKFVRFLQYFQPFVEKDESDWHDKNNAKGHVEYPTYPLKSIIELEKFLGITRGILKDIHIPVLLIHSKDDTSVSPENADFIYQNLASPNKKLIWIKDSGHNIVCDKRRTQVFQFVSEFINANTSMKS